MKRKYLVTSPLQTRRLGQLFARIVSKTKIQKKAKVIGLEGDFGGGKTTFLQGFAKGLGIKERILSPTFVLMKRFRTPNSKFKNFYHIDCYRIQKAKELLNLGFEKIIYNPENIVVIEWADRIKKIVPKDATWIKFKFINKREREILIK